MRPGTQLRVGLDIGGSKVHAVAVDDDGAVVAQARRTTLTGGAGVLRTASEVLLALAAATGTTVRDFVGVGVGVPGLVDPAEGGVAHAVNLGVAGDAMALRESLGRLTGAPVTVENDVNAAALGAALLLELPEPDLAYLSIGTGMAAGVVLDGVLRRGTRHAAGEIGHIPLDPAGPLCPCGQRGCLEVLASGSAIARRWPSPDGLPAAQALFRAADAGDPAARRIRAEVVGHLAGAVRLLVLTLDVGVVVLGGGVAQVGEPLGTAVRQALVHLQAGSPFLQALDLPSRVVMSPPDRPVAAIGAALVGRRTPVRPSTLTAGSPA